MMASRRSPGVTTPRENRMVAVSGTSKAQRIAQHKADLARELSMVRNALSSDSLISNSSSTDLDNDLMDVEMRTSGPNSALVSTEINHDEEYEVDKAKNNLHLNVNALEIVHSKEIARENKHDIVTTFSLEISNCDREESISHSDQLSTALKESLDVHNNVNEGSEFDACNIGTVLTDGKTAINSTVCAGLEHHIGGDLLVNSNNFLLNRKTSRLALQNEIIESITQENQRSLGKLDNASFSKFVEVARVDQELNHYGECIPNSNFKELITLNDGLSLNGKTACSVYNKEAFPKLKQMLTKGLVSDATKQFADAMCMDNLTLLPKRPNGLSIQNRSDSSNYLNHTTYAYATDVPFIPESDTTKSEAQGNLKRGCDINNIQSEVQGNLKRGCDFNNIQSEVQGNLKRGCDVATTSDMRGFSKRCKFISNSSNECNSTIKLSQNATDQEYRNEIHPISNVSSPRSAIGTSSKIREALVTNENAPRNSPPTPLLPPCRVCGEKASGFHYGVNTCEACKGFFRRSLCRKEPYVCVSNGSCQVQSGRRTVCSHCRLKRCLDVGMSKNAIKTGRYTHELRSKNIMEVKSLQQQQLGRGITQIQEDSLLPKLPQGNVHACNIKCEPVINEELQDMLDTLVMAQAHLFEFLDDYYDADMILKRQMDVYKRYKQQKFDRLRNGATKNQLPQSNSCGLSLHNQDKTADEPVTSDNVKEQVMKTLVEDVERNIQGLVMFAKAVPGFENLDVDDQSCLLKCSRFDIWYVGHIRCLNSDLRVGACEWYFHAEELEQVWGQKLVDMAFRLTDYGQKLNLTREETAALRGVSLTFPDRCFLKHRAMVEQIHAKMFECFQYVASKRHPNFNKWLPDVINFLVYLRDFGIEFDKKSSKMNLEWPLIQRNPLLLEVFFG